MIYVDNTLDRVVIFSRQSYLESITVFSLMYIYIYVYIYIYIIVVVVVVVVVITVPKANQKK